MRLLFRLLDWRRESLLLATATMDLFWLYPWLAFFLGISAGSGYIISVGGMWLWIVLAAYTARILNGLSLSLLRQQIVETLKQFPTVKEVIIAVEGETETVLQP